MDKGTRRSGNGHICGARLALAVMACGAAGTSWAAGPTPVDLEAGTGRVLTLHGHAASVFAANPKVAEVRPASATTLFVFGVTPGHTTIAALGTHGNTLDSYDVTVEPSDFAASRVRKLVVGHDRSGLTVRSEQYGLSIAGTATSPDEAADALTAAEGELGKDASVETTMQISGSVQVNLHVKIAEMDRSLTRELGINWQSINTLGQSAAIGVSTANALAAMGSSQSSISFLSRFTAAGRPLALDTIIDALSQDQLIRVLAEPNLVTLSGEPASFLVGGEFPIPVASANNQLTVAFKQYGISLAFIPTVLSDGRINLHVRPEVSQLTTQGAVSISSGNTLIQIPAIKVRRADTTVDLGSGQSFAIAGLLQDTAATTGLGLPFLGDLPILGALFRSSSFQRDESELVIIVTPYVVRPVDAPGGLSLPTDENRPPTDFERIVQQRQSERGLPVDHRPFPDDIGFVLE